MAERLLSIANIRGSYKSGEIVHGVSFSVRPGEVLGVLGLNGMGKTTLLRAIMCLLPEYSGDVVLDGKSVSDGAHRRAQAGIAYVPEDRQVFPRLSVWENVLVAANQVSSHGRNSLGTHNREARISDAFRFFPKLSERRSQLAGTLSGGEQQMLAIARAMVSEPRFVLLDEPSEGLAPKYVDVVTSYIRHAPKYDVGVILVEQNFAMVREVCDRAIVLRRGTVVHESERNEIRSGAESLVKHLRVGASNDH